MIFYFVKKLLHRSYKFLALTFFSLAVGAFLFGGVASLTTSIRSFLISEGKILVGGDIVLRGAYPIATSSQIFSDLAASGHILAEEEQVQVVFKNQTGDKTAAANLRIVRDKFPLYGEVIVENRTFNLEDGGIYAEPDFLVRLGKNVGDEVVLGDKALRILGVIVKEPDNLSVGVSFTPRVIILHKDFLESGISLTQSRVSYKVYVKENVNTALTEREIENLRKYASENKLRFDDATDGPNRLIRGLSSVSAFIGIILTIALFLVTVNITANLVYVLARFKKTIALLKTFGATNGQIQAIYVSILGLIGGLAGFIGSFFGAFAVTLFLPRLASLLDVTIAPAGEMPIALGGGIFGIFFIVCSSVPFLSSLRTVMPKELLSGASRAAPRISLGRLLLFVPILFLLTVLLYVVSKDVLLVLCSVGGLVVLFSVYLALSYALIEVSYRLRHNFPFLLSSIVSFLKWRGFQTYVASASIITAFSCVFIISAIEKNIEYNLTQNISQTAPALYLVDINRSQVDAVKEIVGATFKEYPIIRGRLLSINERDMTKSDDPGITREFNMTYRDQLIEGERVVEGSFGSGSEKGSVVSMDREFGEEAGGVSLGDTVKVFIQGITVSATVTSIREVDSSSGIPFFYMVFDPLTLSKFPASYFGTANVGSEEVESIKSKMASAYPNIIPIETRQIVETVEGVVKDAVLIVSLTGIPSIILGLMLILIMISQSMYERKGDVLILRAFGFEKKKITLLFILESGLFVLVSGFIAYTVAHTVAFLLNHFVFTFDSFAFSLQPLYIIFGSMLLVVVFSYVLSTRIVGDSLKKLLSEK